MIAESGIETRAQGAAAELAGAKAMLVGSTLMRAADPGAKLAELLSRPLVKVCGLTRQEDVDVAVEAGADLVGFILAQESPRRTDELLDAPDTVLRVAVFVGETHETDADVDPVLRARERPPGPRRDPAPERRAGRDRRRPSLGTAPTPCISSAPGRSKAASCSPAASAPPTSPTRSPPFTPWAVDAARSTESEPGVKDHDAVRAWVEAAR